MSLEVPKATSKSGRQEQVQATLLTSWRQIRGSHDPTMGSINFREQLTDHRETLLVFSRVSKDTDEHPDGGDAWGGAVERSSSPALSGRPFSQRLQGPPAQKHSCAWEVAGGSTTQA